LAKLLGKIALLLFGVCLIAAAPVLADSTNTFTLVGKLGDIGKSDIFPSGSLSLVATGYSSTGGMADMWAKNDGPTETGIGLASEMHHEIAWNNFIQLNLTQILATHPTSIVLTIESIEAGEAYNVWGSNTPGDRGTSLASNQTNNKFTLPALGTFNYISISAATLDKSVWSDVLINDVAVTPDAATPEPSSASLLLLGLVTLLSAGTLAKKLIV
jgi:hypothetical protein